ncbi:MAG TPA: PTS fructose transporter subunit IIBC [Staphylococcus sp.]|uniref:PTS fructose transporter subunit IIBC n=1 Tax=Mammaliicoccus vitulinus TaxID=71237 RepID=A0A2T4PVM0_9STAP|nr:MULTISPECIES: fructose-specific PTS transporter subunit EIIC [Mammaliicoccus]HAL08637.1 PTS fructose transporter subunit IIBC [Staphylococcus sp.]MBO3078297.1 PTS transporter subunit EIIC [Mammaliicoccus vitulinus]PTI30488.1 PTS fructose transporter subunit IIBC [Mammaliicoccus vitulinus]QQT15373.1 PTS transporter subunit EIIC [Mammaliicoccus vitulinus]QQY19324.1 PTS transporter subunit EIIC [Mammaliicoccus vitulinus]
MNIVGITACPTGIAHTYMAAEKLSNTATKLGHNIKIETQGSKIDNILTQEEINNADLIILAIDKDIDLSRFRGMSIKKTSTANAIKDPENLIEDGLNNVDVIYIENDNGDRDSKSKTGIYNHFMNGVNYMLPFVIAGGILIAISFAFGINASNPDSDSYNRFAAALSKIGGDTAFQLMVPALSAGIASSIAGRAGFAPGLVAGTLATVDGSGFLGGMISGLLAGYVTNALANKVKIPKSISALYHLIIVPLVSILIVGLAMIFLINTPISWLLETLTHWLNSLGQSSGILFGLLIGAMMAADMGGPINKSVSTFSIGLMSAGVTAPIAACMVAGMTPPLGLALATLLFKNKFTIEERASGKSCWVLGASYITEGAIPFAVADPLRVIPSLILGSATAAAISMGAGITSLAPHGGIWIMFIPNVINHLFIYTIAIISGTVVTALSVGLLKKKITIRQEIKSS